MSIAQHGSFCGLSTHSSYLSENPGTGFGLLCQALIAVSVSLADLVMVSWQNQDMAQSVLHHSRAVKGEHFDALCR